jgi:hypothetical protein
MHLIFITSKLDLMLDGIAAESKFKVSPLPVVFNPAKQEVLNNTTAAMTHIHVFMHILLESRSASSGWSETERNIK